MHNLNNPEHTVTNCVNITTHTDELTVQHWAHCTRSVVESSESFPKVRETIFLKLFVLRCLFLHPAEAPKPEVSASTQEHNEAPLPPFSDDDILSGFEDHRLPRLEQITMWSTMTPEEILPEHVVDIRIIAGDFRDSIERMQTSSTRASWVNKFFTSQSLCRRGREDAFETKCRKVAPDNPSRSFWLCRTRKSYTNTYVTHFAGCAFLFNKDTFHSNVDVKSVCRHDTRRIFARSFCRRRTWMGVTRRCLSRFLSACCIQRPNSFHRFIVTHQQCLLQEKRYCQENYPDHSCSYDLSVNTIHPEPEIHEQIYIWQRLRNNVHDYKHILTNAERIVNNNGNDATHADKLTMQHWAHCTRSVVVLPDPFTFHTGSRPLALFFSLSSHPCTCVFVLCCVLFHLTFYFLLYFTFLPFLFLLMANSNDSMILNTFCNSANGTFVTLTIACPTHSQNIDVVAVDLNGAACRCRSRDSISSFDEVFSDCALPTPQASTPLCGLGSILDTWADVCFLKPLGSENFWKVNRHGAYSIPLQASWITRQWSKLPSWDVASFALRWLE